MPPAIVELAERRAISLSEVKLCERIAFDLWPERFVARLEPSHRAVLTMALIQDFNLSRIRGTRLESIVIEELRAALAQVLETHA